MPRKPGVKNKKTLEKEAANLKATQEVASTVSTAVPPTKAKVNKAEPLPEVTVNIPHIVDTCTLIYNNLHETQKQRWAKGTGKEAPHYASPGHKMAAVLINFFDLGISKEESLQLFNKEYNATTTA